MKPLTSDMRRIQHSRMARTLQHARRIEVYVGTTGLHIEELQSGVEERAPLLARRRIAMETTTERPPNLASDVEFIEAGKDLQFHFAHREFLSQEVQERVGAEPEEYWDNLERGGAQIPRSVAISGAIMRGTIEERLNKALADVNSTGVKQELFHAGAELAGIDPFLILYLSSGGSTGVALSAIVLDWARRVGMQVYILVIGPHCGNSGTGYRNELRNHFWWLSAVERQMQQTPKRLSVDLFLLDGPAGSREACVRTAAEFGRCLTESPNVLQVHRALVNSLRTVRSRECVQLHLIGSASLTVPTAAWREYYRSAVAEAGIGLLAAEFSGKIDTPLLPPAARLLEQAIRPAQGALTRMALDELARYPRQALAEEALRVRILAQVAKRRESLLSDWLDRIVPVNSRFTPAQVAAALTGSTEHLELRAQEMDSLIDVNKALKIALHTRLQMQAVQPQPDEVLIKPQAEAASLLAEHFRGQAAALRSHAARFLRFRETLLAARREVGTIAQDARAVYERALRPNGAHVTVPPLCTHSIEQIGTQMAAHLLGDLESFMSGDAERESLAERFILAAEQHLPEPARVEEAFAAAHPGADPGLYGRDHLDAAAGSRTGLHRDARDVFGVRAALILAAAAGSARNPFVRELTSRSDVLALENDDPSCVEIIRITFGAPVRILDDLADLPELMMDPQWQDGCAEPWNADDLLEIMERWLRRKSPASIKPPSVIASVQMPIQKVGSTNVRPVSDSKGNGATNGHNDWIQTGTADADREALLGLCPPSAPPAEEAVEGANSADSTPPCRANNPMDIRSARLADPDRHGAERDSPDGVPSTSQDPMSLGEESGKGGHNGSFMGPAAASYGEMPISGELESIPRIRHRSSRLRRVWRRPGF